MTRPPHRAARRRPGGRRASGLPEVAWPLREGRRASWLPHRAALGATAAALLPLITAACGGTITHRSSSTPTSGSTSPATPPPLAVETRLLVQQGLSIGLSSNVLQTQVTVLDDTLNDNTACTALLAGAGSAKVLQESVSGAATTSHVDIYHDAGCSKHYIDTTAKITQKGISTATGWTVGG